MFIKGSLYKNTYAYCIHIYAYDNNKNKIHIYLHKFLFIICARDNKSIQKLFLSYNICIFNRLSHYSVCKIII